MLLVELQENKLLVKIGGLNDDAKRASSGGIDPWNTSEYLNMWIVPKMTTVSGGRTINLLGYAQFPGGAAATDGLVMIYNAFGRVGAVSAPYDGGRTTTHEIGHFLNLRHIWGDANCGNDFVSDTPTHQTSNSGCPTGQVSCSSTDMPQNYMDYTNDSCMNLFTLGQKNRMRSVLDAGGSRRSLALSDKCGAVVVAPTCSDGIKNGNETGVDCGGSSCEPCQTACTDNEVTINITFDNYPEETSWSLVNDSGATIATGAYSKSNADGSTVSETLCLPDDCYTFTIKDAYGDGMCCSYGNGSYTITGPDGSIKTGGTFGASEATDFCFIPAPTCTDGIKNGDETEIDCGGSSCEPCQVTCIDTALTIKFDNYPEETSWNLKDNSGAIVASGGTYASQADGSTLVINNCLPLGCYTLEFKDTYGDGMCCSYGNGSYALTNSSTGAVLASGASYTSTDTNTFCASNTREETVKTFETPLSIKIYPNPVTGNELNVVTENGEQSTYKIISTLGQVLLYGELNDVRSTINVSNLNTGVYFIVVKNDITNTTKQFIKK